MAWTANLDRVSKSDNGNVIASVTFASDTGETIIQDIGGNDLTPDGLAAFCANKVQVLEVRDIAFQTFVTLGPVKLPAKTPDQQAQLDALGAAVAQAQKSA